jgi:N-acetylglucosamine transport system permease protein
MPTMAVDKRARGSLRLFSGLAHLALVLWAIAVIVPICYTVLGSFKSNEELFGDPLSLPSRLRWENWATAWEKAHIGGYMLNSVIVVSGGVFGTMLLGSMAAYALARYPFRGNRVIYYYFVLGLSIPGVVALVPLFFVVKNLGLLNTFHGLILVYIGQSLSFTIFFLAAFFKTLPSETAEAAIMDGASHTRVFFQIMLPMARPGMISVTIFNVIGQWNQYIFPLILLPDPDKWLLTQGVAQLSTQAGYQAEWGPMFAALTMSMLPVIVVYAIFQRQIQSGLTAGAVK